MKNELFNCHSKLVSRLHFVLTISVIIIFNVIISKKDIYNDNDIYEC